MDDVLLVRGLKRIGDLSGDGQRLVERNGSLPDAIRERGTFDELQHQRAGCLP